MVLVSTVTLLWAKWLPYGAKISELSFTHTWPGSDILAVGGVEPGDPPTWSAATSFTWTYASAVWKALLAALLISAAVQAWVPRHWLLRVMRRPGALSGALVGGALSTPSMMCACCTAPVAVTLRRRGASIASVIAYWLGNPLLNPAVVVFLLLVAPWQWTATRLAVGVLLVVGGAALVARITRSDTGTDVAGTTGTPRDPVTPAPRAETTTWTETGRAAARAAANYAGALMRLSITLVPEYLVVVMLIGATRGWLLSGADSDRLGVLAVLIAAVLGTALVIPTAAEIPILHGLALAGMAQGVIGALLVTLPAISLPGIAMVTRTFGWRVTTATTCAVIAGGVLAAGLITLL